MNYIEQYKISTRGISRTLSNISVFRKLWTHLFPMHPFSTPWKHQKTVRVKCWELICSANQWTGFYMITASVMKELKKKFRSCRALSCSNKTFLKWLREIWNFFTYFTSLHRLLWNQSKLAFFSYSLYHILTKIS